ncbi:MAG: PAS domain S-box protein [Polyangiales bacterium]
MRAEPSDPGAPPGPLAAAQRGIADAMPQIVWTHDANGVATYFNRKWTEYTGLDLAETLRVGPHTLVHPGDYPEVARLFEAARAGLAPIEVEYRLRRARDGAWRWHVARVIPLVDERGAPPTFVGVATDIDDQRRAREVQRFLVEASNVLGTSLDLTRTLNDVAQLVVPHLADWCAIDMLTEQGGLERAAVAHVDPAKVSLGWELWRRLPPDPRDPRGVYGVLRTRRAERLEEIPDALLAETIPDPDLLATVRRLGLRSSICVPLVARDGVLGALTLVSAESGRRYDADDAAFAEEFARRIAIAVDNARLYTEATAARAAAEAVAAEVVAQCRAAEASLLTMRAERDAALARAAALERARPPETAAP